MKHVNYLIILVTMAGCSSTPKGNDGKAIEPDQVLSRIDDLGERPSWIKESASFTVGGGNVTALGQTTIPGDHRVEAAYRIAENSAKAAIAGGIEQRLDFVFQNSEEGTGMDSTQARYIGAEAAKITTSSLRPSKRYWEKVLTTDESGNKRTVYRVFATVSMPEADFRKAVIDAARKQNGKGGLSQDFSKKVDAHWDKFVSGLSETAPVQSGGQ
jgi:hypothetical protein